MNKLILLSGILGLAVFGLVGCETNNTNMTRNSNMMNTANVNSNTAIVVNENTSTSKVADDDDEEFMKEAAQGGMAEVKLGELQRQKLKTRR